MIGSNRGRRLSNHLRPHSLESRRTVLLVPHALGKCPECGSTLVNDPLPHRCELWARGKDYDPGRVGL